MVPIEMGGGCCKNVTAHFKNVKGWNQVIVISPSVFSYDITSTCHTRNSARITM